jgi:hypothetical protein
MTSGPTIGVLVYVILASTLFVWSAEKTAEKFNGKPLQRWQRLLVPVPILIFLVANLDGLWSLWVYLETHPGVVAARYSENQAWSADRFFYVGAGVALVLPFLLVRPAWKAVGFAPILWAAHLVWMLIVWAPLLLISGVPLRN